MVNSALAYAAVSTSRGPRMLHHGTKHFFKSVRFQKKTGSIFADEYVVALDNTLSPPENHQTDRSTFGIHNDTDRSTTTDSRQLTTIFLSVPISRTTRYANHTKKKLTSGNGFKNGQFQDGCCRASKWLKRR